MEEYISISHSKVKVRRRRGWIRLGASSGACGTSSSYLIRESAGSKVTKRELELSIAAVNIDLEHDDRIRVGG